MAVLCGLMIGSLRRVWPFQESIGDPAARMTQQVLPTAWTAEVTTCALIGGAAFCAVLLLKKWSGESSLRSK